MAEKTDWYGRLKHALFRFACGAPLIDEQFKCRTRAEVEQALKWIDWLEREQARDDEWQERQEQAGRNQRRKKKEKVENVVNLVRH